MTYFDNQLVPTRSAPPDPWDSPPIDHQGQMRNTSTEVAKALQDAQDAKRRGDHSLAVLRQGDAEALSQKRWDWGNRRTWMIVAALSLFGLMISIAALWLPAGQHAANPPIYLY